MNDFADRYERCDNCDETWLSENTLECWYVNFKTWVSRGECFLLKDGFDQETQVIDHIKPEAYYNCLFAYLESETGERYEKSIRFTETENPQDRKIIGYKMTASTIKITSTAGQGP